MSIGSTLFPPANREAAATAFLRTFWQVVRATGALGGAGAIVVSAADIQHIDLVALAYIVGAVLASGVLSGLLAAGDILVHGLPNAYQTAAIAAVPAAVVAAAAPVAPIQDIGVVPPVLNVPVIAPADASQPAIDPAQSAAQPTPGI